MTARSGLSSPVCVSASDTNRVSFTLTNQYKKVFAYQYEMKEFRAGLSQPNWISVRNNRDNPTLAIASHAAVECHAIVPSTNRWRIAFTRKTENPTRP
jgi:hypothetical protein